MGPYRLTFPNNSELFFLPTPPALTSCVWFSSKPVPWLSQPVGWFALLASLCKLLLCAFLFSFFTFKYTKQKQHSRPEFTKGVPLLRNLHVLRSGMRESFSGSDLRERLARTQGLPSSQHFSPGPKRRCLTKSSSGLPVDHVGQIQRLFGQWLVWGGTWGKANLLF